jgi:hypothetical protein
VYKHYTHNWSNRQAQPTKTQPNWTIRKCLYNMKNHCGYALLSAQIMNSPIIPNIVIAAKIVLVIFFVLIS